MTLKGLPSVDLMLFWGLIGTMGVAHSLLLTSGTPWESVTWFYITMWLSSMVILIFAWMRYREEDQFDYDEGLNQRKLGYIIMGITVTLFLAALLVKIYTSTTSSSIWVPQPQATLAIAGLSLSAVINDLFYQLALVSNSEETMVLALSQVIRRKLTESTKLSDVQVRGASIAIPRAGWATLHAYLSYTGEMMPILVVSAFISGVVMSVIAYHPKVRSFLAAVLIHFGFNGTLVVLRALGWI
jgi:hypothetical protein